MRSSSFTEQQWMMHQKKVIHAHMAQCVDFIRQRKGAMAWHATKSIEGARLQKGKKGECHRFSLDCRDFK
jgi:hypothetical protein